MTLKGEILAEYQNLYQTLDRRYDEEVLSPLVKGLGFSIGKIFYNASIKYRKLTHMHDRISRPLKNRLDMEARVLDLITDDIASPLEVNEKEHIFYDIVNSGAVIPKSMLKWDKRIGERAVRVVEEKFQHYRDLLGAQSTGEETFTQLVKEKFKTEDNYRNAFNGLIQARKDLFSLISDVGNHSLLTRMFKGMDRLHDEELEQSVKKRFES